MEAYRDQYATLFNGGRKVAVIAISVDAEQFDAAKAKLDAAGVEYLGPDRGVRRVHENVVRRERAHVLRAEEHGHAWTRPA